MDDANAIQTTATKEPYENPDQILSIKLSPMDRHVKRHVMHWNREVCVVCGMTLCDIVDGNVEGCEDVWSNKAS